VGTRKGENKVKVFFVASIAAILIALSGFHSQVVAQDNRDRILPIMTRNLDEATDFGPIFQATTSQDFAFQVAAAYQEVQASNIPERAAGIADEIAAKQPYLVGLQEASVWSTGPLFKHADTEVFNALNSLLTALAARNQHYTVIAALKEFEGEAPSALGIEIGFADFDVLIARTDVSVSELKVSNIQAQHFVTILTFPNPILGQVTIPRGWISVDGKLRGKDFRFVTTHLEGFDPRVQAQQATELVQGPGNTNLPVIMAGDFNTAPLASFAVPGCSSSGGSPATNLAYNIIASGGFADAWTILHPSDLGFTWPLHCEDPFTPSITPDQRLDLVLFRNGQTGLDVLTTDLIGNMPSDLMASGLWPSDHAGVTSVFRLEP
jgi:endonuclease/exonuclease/phosphatase family metal-dependent hydrolase